MHYSRTSRDKNMTHRRSLSLEAWVKMPGSCDNLVVNMTDCPATIRPVSYCPATICRSFFFTFSRPFGARSRNYYIWEPAWRLSLEACRLSLVAYSHFPGTRFHESLELLGWVFHQIENNLLVRIFFYFSLVLSITYVFNILVPASTTI